MDYKYHIQPQAEKFARSILPVPHEYPLREGLPKLDYNLKTINI